MNVVWIFAVLVVGPTIVATNASIAAIKMILMILMMFLFSRVSRFNIGLFALLLLWIGQLE